ncbi:MAG: GNAT family N-acetyltransferase [Nocardioides sp.]|uniref:GNAT family N-acetyltransferase n=1 Tax=Nocardioides sp. TaxID=35761 RepID=UPI0039E6D6C9
MHTGQDRTDVVGRVALSTDQVDRAWAVAEAAAARAGVTVSTATGLTEYVEVSGLLDRIWGSPVGQSTLSSDLLAALAHSHNYVGVVRRGEQVVGAAAGFFSSPPATLMHSHIAGVVAGARGRGVGYALKLHQRAWALAHGATRMTWTFDPLVARNAYFNVTRLGATIEEYLPNFYGDMDDAINGHGDSDRILAHWELTRPLPMPAGETSAERVEVERVPILCRGSDGPAAVATTVPAPARGRMLEVEIPSDVEALRARDAVAAECWRLVLRDALAPAFAAGWAVTGFRRDGCYLLTPEGESVGAAAAAAAGRTGLRRPPG